MIRASARLAYNGEEGGGGGLDTFGLDNVHCTG